MIAAWKRATRLSLLALGLSLSLAAVGQASPKDQPGGGVPCEGCKGELILGATVAVPGYTIGVEPGDPNPDDGKDHDPNGKCERQEGICAQAKGCTFYTKYTFGAPKGKVVQLVGCWWKLLDDGTWGWWCLVVNPNFSGTSSHVEAEGTYSCGEQLKRKISLGPASQVFTWKCHECAD